MKASSRLGISSVKLTDIFSEDVLRAANVHIINPVEYRKRTLVLKWLKDNGKQLRHNDM